MRLLVAAPYYYPKMGGLETYARELGRALRDLEGWEVVVVAGQEPGRGDVTDQVDGMTVYRLGTWARLSNTPLGPLWPAKIRRIVRRERPDLILAHTPVPSMADAAALGAGRTPFVVAYHAATLLKEGSPMFNLLASGYRVYQRITLARACRIVAVSDFVKQQLPVGVRGRTVVLPNAIWENDIRGRDQPSGASFLFIGSLDRTHAWKGLDLVLQAVADYRKAYGDPVELTVLGDGNNRANYEAKARVLGVDDVVSFLGLQTGEVKEAAFARATALVIYPTTANDAFPTVMLEGWARGVPVIAARIGALPTLIDDRADGFLADPHDPAGLARTLRQIAVMTEAERGAVATAAASRVHDHYTWERQAADFAKLASELI
jgi:glycosyltransferase involved in cell wall biosynthesis